MERPKLVRYEIKSENVTPATISTIEKIQQRRRRKPVIPRTKSNLFDNSSSLYSWLSSGWIAEERIVPSGRLYRYYYDPSGKQYSRKYKVETTTSDHRNTLVVISDSDSNTESDDPTPDLNEADVDAGETSSENHNLISSLNEEPGAIPIASVWEQYPGGEGSSDGKKSDAPEEQEAPERILSAEKQREVDVFHHARMYQGYMNQMQIPVNRMSVIPFDSWMMLGRSMKQLYAQPLHYLTNLQLKKWDQARTYAENERDRLDILIDPRKAESAVWLMEEIHRTTVSHHYLTRLWLAEGPIYRGLIDPFNPAEKYSLKKY